MPIFEKLPEPTEIEISLFGPGVGEAICVHIGGGKWVIIDSCVNPKTKKVAAHEYLTSIGVNLEKDVLLIVISHWHDDHVRGIASLVEVCTSAKVALPNVMLEAEMVEFGKLLSGSSSEGLSSGLNELSKVVNIIHKELSLNKCRIILASENCRILNDELVQIFALSPSNAAMIQAKLDFSLMAAPSRTSKQLRFIPAPTSNINAVALWIESASGNVLLGADLETHTNTLLGWDAILQSAGKPTSKASLVKIPHHGSITGHSPSFWQNMMINQPVGILTCFSKTPLPKPSDVERLKTLTSRLYCTSVPKIKLPKRSKIVDQYVKTIAKERRLKCSPELGHIQARISSTGNITIKMNKHAQELI